MKINVGFMKNMKDNRTGETAITKQGCLAKIIEYNNYSDILVEFQDAYKYKVRASYKEFKNGSIKNWYYPSVCGVGIVGERYKDYITSNKRKLPEYKMWSSMLSRCFDKKYKEKEPAYEDVTCCEEWLLFENFYEWFHKQDNFDKCFYDEDYAIDKDILFKGNKIYSPETCCLVPRIINSLFIKRARDRGEFPIGVTAHKEKYRARCDNPLLNTRVHIGLFATPELAFEAYKIYKERLIKQVAQIEYNNSNITKECYDAMMDYEVEITD